MPNRTNPLERARRWHTTRATVAAHAGRDRLQITPTRVANTWWDIACAFVLLLPSDTLGASPGYRVVLDMFGHDWVVGWLLVTVAAIRLTAMVHPLPSHERTSLAAAATMIGFLVWLAIAVGILIAAPVSLGSYAYLGIAGLHAWSYIEARAEQR